MTRANQTQGNTPGRKPIDISDDYWDRRYQEERKANRGAPDSPYAPPRDFQENVRTLSAAPKKTDTLELQETLDSLESITLVWTFGTANSSRYGYIKLNDKSTPISFTIDNESTQLKWGNRIIDKNLHDLNDDLDSLIGFLKNSAKIENNKEISFTTE